MARNTLFLAVTRPALFAGLPIEAAVVILLTSVITLIGTTNPVYGLVVAAVRFGISRLVVPPAVTAFRPLFLWGRTKAANRNRAFGAGWLCTTFPDGTTAVWGRRGEVGEDSVGRRSIKK